MAGIDQYANDVKSEVQKRLGNGYSVEVQKTTKNNDITLTGLAIRKGDARVATNIYLDGLFKDNREDAADEVIRMYEDAPEFTEDIELGDFGSVKDRICYRLTNTDKNRRRLDKMPHRDFMDLSAVYFVSMNVGGQEASVAVTDAMASIWGVTEQELWDTAFVNTQRRYPARVCSILDIVGSMTGETVEFDSGDEAEQFPMLVASNDKGINGAGVIFYDDVLTQLTDRLGDRIYIIPSSVHEMLAIPTKSVEPGRVRQTVLEVNGSIVADEEVLSDSVYVYEKGGSIEIVEEGQ